MVRVDCPEGRQFLLSQSYFAVDATDIFRRRYHHEKQIVLLEQPYPSALAFSIGLDALAIVSSKHRKPVDFFDIVICHVSSLPLPHFLFTLPLSISCPIQFPHPVHRFLPFRMLSTLFQIASVRIPSPISKNPISRVSL